MDPSENKNLSMDAEIQKKEAEKINQTLDKGMINNKNPEVNIKDENINEIQNEDDKNKLDKIKLENEKGKIQENEIKISGAYIQNDNIEKSISDYSLDDLLNYIKVKSEEFKDEPKIQDKDKDIEKNNYMTLNSTLTMFQMHNRFFLILQQLDKYKDTIKEIKSSQSSQKIITEHKIEIEKILIEVNVMKSVVESLKIPSFVIMRRKLLDLIIFSLLKSNKDKFHIHKNYCPNNNFLEKILGKIEKYSKKILRKDDVEKINLSKDFINELINKNEKIIEFPLSCSDNNLEYIMKYLSFCKRKYNKVKHASKEALKYYLYLFFNNRIDPKTKELLNLFIKCDEIKGNSTSIKRTNELNSHNIIENEEEKKEDNQDGNDKNEGNNNYSEPLKINIDTALEFFLLDNLSSEDDNSKLKKILEKIETNKVSLLDKYHSYTNQRWEQILNEFEKFDKEQENYMKIFNPKEKELINNVVKNFEDSLKSLENNLLKLEGTDDETAMKELIDQFFCEYSRISKKELSFDKSYFMGLCESGEGRYLLIFFQIQLMKYQLLNSYSKIFANKFENNFNSNKEKIIQEYSKLKDQSRKLLDEIKKINNIESPKKLFKEWKFINCIHLEEGFNDFKSFINRIKNYVGVIDLRFDDDFLNEQITFLWIMKNNLHQYLD